MNQVILPLYVASVQISLVIGLVTPLAFVVILLVTFQIG